MHRLCLSRIDADVKSFKVTVNSENRDKLLDGNLWPENVHVRKYFSKSSKWQKQQLITYV